MLAVAGFCLTACEKEDKGSRPPVYQGFRCTPAIAYAGDSLTITAVQKEKGKYLNATDYSWRLIIPLNDSKQANDTLTYSYHTNYGGTDSSDPTWRVRIPSNAQNGGMATCSFMARFSNSADGVGGMFSAEPGEGCSGSINSYSYVLYSQANGNFRFRIQTKQ